MIAAVAAFAALSVVVVFLALTANDAIVDRAAAVLCLSMLLTTSPSILGETYPLLTVLWILPALILYLRLGSRRGDILIPAGILMLLGTLLPSLQEGQLRLGAWVSSSAAIAVVALLASTVATSRRSISFFLTLLYGVVLWQVVAFMQVLGTTSPLGGVSFNPLVETAGGRNWTYQVTDFGATVVYGGQVFPEVGPRLTGWFGEPGLFAVVVVLLGLLDYSISTRFRYRQLLVLPVLVFTQSFAGLVAIFVAASVLFVAAALSESSKRPALAFCASAATLTVGATVLLGGGGLSFQAKQEGSSQSVADRLSVPSPQGLLGAWMEHPLGTGLQFEGQLGQINAIVGSLTYGPLLLGVWVLLYGLLPARFGLGQRETALHVVVLVTILFAQPAFYPLWFFFGLLGMIWLNSFDGAGSIVRGRLRLVGRVAT